jgi:dihydrolipoamide dehydrogenase
MSNTRETDVVVVGGGPGGYAAAFYAADRGQRVLLVEQESRLGGVCLLRGCIPSKALLHTTHLITGSQEAAVRGLQFAPPTLDLAKMRAWKDSVIQRLTGGLQILAKQRKVEVLQGRAHLEDGKTLRVETATKQEFCTFKHAILALGSRPAMPRDFDLGNPRIMTSTEALDLPDVPEKLLVVGGGYIGMELGTVYAALGSKVSVLEAAPSILLGADPDLVQPVRRRAEKAFASIRVGAKVLGMKTEGSQVKVTVELGGQTQEEQYDRVLVAVGRVANVQDVGLENTQIKLTERGFIEVDSAQRTAEPLIYAIGDVVGGAMLAHKASREARVAVDAMLGESTRFERVIVPAVVFTDPELAWCGLTEEEAKRDGVAVQTVRFPWGASGRALTMDRPEGVTKLVIDQETERILGVGLCGSGAGELISEGVLAIEMGATVRDLAESIHPHPTLSETLMEAAEQFYGTATHAAPRPSERAEHV